MNRKVKLTKRRGFYTISLFKKFVKLLKWEDEEYLELVLNNENEIIIKKLCK